MKDLYCFAELNIEIESLCPDVHSLCADYRAEGFADFFVQTSEADIAFERERSSGLPCSDGYLEKLAVYRKIAEKLPYHNAVLIHGSCVAVDGDAYLFTAKSGMGKSTHARLWRELLEERAVMVNDDKPLLRITESGVTAYGTPWNGKHRLGANISAPLKALCVLTRAETNQITPITAAEAYPMLLQQVYRPFEPEALERTLRLVDRLAASVKLYRLGCNMEPEAAEIAFAAMK